MLHCDCEHPIAPSNWFESETWDGTCRRCGREMPPSWFGVPVPDACEKCGRTDAPLRETITHSLAPAGLAAYLCPTCAAAEADAHKQVVARSRPRTVSF